METEKISWSEERIALLTELWAEGLSTSKIAVSLGDVSRNSVIGKVHRLGLPGRKTTSRSSKARSSGRKRRIASPRPVQGASALEPVKASAPKPMPRLVIVSEMEKVVEIAAGVKLLDLDEHMCRWPEGDPKAGDFHFCGRRSVESLSYCARHARLAFKSLFWRQNRERQKGRSIETSR
jgi:GcrA cell cycle regulator